MNVHVSAMPTGGTEPPKIKGGLPWVGHMVSFAANPYKFVERVAATAGEIASFTLLGQKIVLLTGDQASELFYLSSDEQTRRVRGVQADDADLRRRAGVRRADRA